jgi:hypothetical protein
MTSINPGSSNQSICKLLRKSTHFGERAARGLCFKLDM